MGNILLAGFCRICAGWLAWEIFRIFVISERGNCKKFASELAVFVQSRRSKQLL